MWTKENIIGVVIKVFDTAEYEIVFCENYDFALKSIKSGTTYDWTYTIDNFLKYIDNKAWVIISKPQLIYEIY